MTVRLFGANGQIISSPPISVLSTQYPAVIPPEEPEPPVQTATRPWMGSSAPEGLVGFRRLEDTIVKRKLELYRLFDSTFNPNPRDKLLSHIEAGRVPVYSLKEPSGDTASRTAQWTTFANNIKDLPGFVIVILNHEPENDAGYTVGQFGIDFTLFYETVKPIVGAGVWLGPCYMGVSSYSAARAAWWALLDTLPMDILMADAYNQVNKRSFAQIFDRFGQKAATRTDLVPVTGIPWGVTEVSTHGTDDEREVWVKGAQAYWELPTKNMLKIVLWYDSDLGDNAAYVGWRLERALPDGWYPQVIPERDPVKLYARSKPADWQVGIEWVTDTKTPAAFAAAMNTPRRALGPAGAPPPDPPIPPDYGPLPLGATDYPIPTTGKVIYISPNGNDGAAGTLAAPYKTLTRAFQNQAEWPVEGGTVVMRGGDYPVNAVTTPWRRGPIVVQAYPGEEVWFVGSDVVTGWIQDATGPGGVTRWRKSNWVTNFDRTALDLQMIDPLHPESQWPEQVWINDVALEQVSTLADVDATAPNEDTAPGTFWYDTVGRVMWIGSTPFNNTVRIAVRQVALSGQIDPEFGNPRVDLLGIGVKHYATSSKQLGAVRLYGSDTVVENCHFVGNSADGLFHQIGQGFKIRHNLFERNGRLGAHGTNTMWADIHHNVFYKNNRKMSATFSAAGGGKWDKGSHACFIHHNLVEDNWGHGVWVDLGSHYAAIWKNEFRDQIHGGAGAHVELSIGASIVGNYFRGNGVGFQGSSSSTLRLWNNTFVDNTLHLRIQRSDLPDDPDGGYFFAQVNHEIYNNVFVQIITDNNVRMLQYQDPHGGTEDWIETNLKSDSNAFYFKVRGTAKTAGLTIPGTTTFTNYDLLSDLQAATTLDDNSIAVYDNATNPYLEADLVTPKAPLIETGRPVPANVRDWLEISVEEAATPNRGAF